MGGLPAVGSVDSLLLNSMGQGRVEAGLDSGGRPYTFVSFMSHQALFWICQ